jgi:hypothetical protein
MPRPYGQTTALFAALLLTLATVEGPGSGQLSGDVLVGEKLRIIRDRVTALQATPAGEVTKVAGCISGYWRNC